MSALDEIRRARGLESKPEPVPPLAAETLIEMHRDVLELRRDLAELPDELARRLEPVVEIGQAMQRITSAASSIERAAASIHKALAEAEKIEKLVEQRRPKWWKTAGVAALGAVIGVVVASAGIAAFEKYLPPGGVRERAAAWDMLMSRATPSEVELLKRIVRRPAP